MTSRELWDRLGSWLINYACKIGGGYGRDECVSDAHFGFMEAVQTWTGQKDSFREWAKHRVRATVRHRIEREHRRKRLCPRVQAVMERFIDHRPAWTVEGFLGGLTQRDAVLVIRTVMSIDTVDKRPVHVDQINPPHWGFGIRKIKRVLMDRLRAKGWNRRRIALAVQAIKEALK